MWTKYKREFTNKFFTSLEDVDQFITKMVNSTTNKQVMSICGFNYIFLNKFWSTL